MLKRLTIQITGLLVWFGLIQASLAIRNIPMGTFQGCRDGE